MPKVGLVGVGHMGRGFAKNMLERGVRLSVHDSRADAIEPLRAQGVRVASSAADLAAQVDIVITSLPGADAMREVYAGPAGIFEGARTGTVLIDTTTNDPAVSETVGSAALARGFEYLDVPVLRDAQAAWDARTILLVGGEVSTHKKCRPLFGTFAEDSIHIGAIGDAQRVKIVNNAVSQANMFVLFEAFAVAKAIGLDLGVLRQVIGRGIGGSNALDYLAPSLVNDDPAFRFSVNMAKKDCGLFLDLAREAGVLAVQGEGARNLASIAVGMGYGEENISRVYSALTQLARR